MHSIFLLLFVVITSHASSLYQKNSNRHQLINYLDQTVAYSYDILTQEWQIFKETYNKKYSSEEENFKRMQIFADNKLFVARHNDLYEKQVVTYTVEINKFSDLTTEEFNAIYGLKKKNFEISEEDASDEETSFLPLDSIIIPEEKDWRKHNAVNIRVRDQGTTCGSCWAFSAVGALEGQYFLRKKGPLVEMSVQNLIDCSYTNEGCEGGLPRKAFAWAKRNGGIDTEKSYPYEGKDDRCRFKSDYAVEGPNGFRYLKEKTEEELKIYVGAFGPVSVLVDAQGPGFIEYKQGVYFNATCSTKISHLTHAVLVVGYGVENGSDYWLVKNSWGANWGDKGYIKMARNRHNHCGIALEASIPTFKKMIFK